MQNIIQNNIKFYYLPFEHKLYRGNTDQYLNNIPLHSIREYFGLDERVAGLYGLVSEYSVNKKTGLMLYAMDDINNVKKLYE